VRQAVVYFLTLALHLLANVKSRKLRYFDHIMRGKNKFLDKGIIKRTLLVERDEDQDQHG